MAVKKLSTLGVPAMVTFWFSSFIAGLIGVIILVTLKGIDRIWIFFRREFSYFNLNTMLIVLTFCFQYVFVGLSIYSLDITFARAMVALSALYSFAILLFYRKIRLARNSIGWILVVVIGISSLAYSDTVDFDFFRDWMGILFAFLGSLSWLFYLQFTFRRRQSTPIDGMSSNLFAISLMLLINSFLILGFNTIYSSTANLVNSEFLFYDSKLVGLWFAVNIFRIVGVYVIFLAVRNLVDALVADFVVSTGVFFVLTFDVVFFDKMISVEGVVGALLFALGVVALRNNLRYRS